MATNCQKKGFKVKTQLLHLTKNAFNKSKSNYQVFIRKSKNNRFEL